MELIQENWLPFLAAIYLLGMVLYGHHRGFIRLAVSLTALILTLVIVNLTQPYVVNYIEENTTVRTSVGEMLLRSVGFDQNGSQEIPGAAPEQQVQIIEGLGLPDSVKDALISNNNSAVYQLLGVDAFVDYISAYLAGVVIEALTFVVLFLVVFILIQMAVRWLDLIARLPILSGVNQIAGALLGGILGLFYFWIACLILSIFVATPVGAALMGQIERCGWLYALYQNNLLGMVMTGILQGLFLGS